jgi:hypothetical protein
MQAIGADRRESLGATLIMPLHIDETFAKAPQDPFLVRIAGRRPERMAAGRHEQPPGAAQVMRVGERQQFGQRQVGTGRSVRVIDHDRDRLGRGCLFQDLREPRLDQRRRHDSPGIIGKPTGRAWPHRIDPDAVQEGSP